MDTSEQYIKMCEKAEEIRKLKPTAKYSNALSPERIEIDSGANYYGITYCGNNTVERIWLPRQDQLQEMCWELTGAKWTPFFALTMVRDFANNLQLGESRYETMEQLWLVFVMKEKHNKIWDGENWIEDTS